MRSHSLIFRGGKKYIKILKRLLPERRKFTKLKCKCVESYFEFILVSEVGSVSNNFLVFLEVVEYLSEQEDDVKVQLSDPEKRRSNATSLQGLRATHIHTETVLSHIL